MYLILETNLVSCADGTKTSKTLGVSIHKPKTNLPTVIGASPKIFQVEIPAIDLCLPKN